MLGGLRPLRQFRHTTGGVVPGYFARKVHDEIGTRAGQVCVSVCESESSHYSQILGIQFEKWKEAFE